MPLLENNARVGRFVVQRLIKHNLYTETYRAVDENNTPYFLKVFVMSRIGSKLVNPQSDHCSLCGGTSEKGESEAGCQQRVL